MNKKPFTIAIPDETLQDLRDRLARVRSCIIRDDD
jgi:hypothetical protein